MGARAWPFGCLCPSPDFLGCGTRFAQTVLAPQLDFGTGAQPGARIGDKLSVGVLSKRDKIARLRMQKTANAPSPYPLPVGEEKNCKDTGSS